MAREWEHKVLRRLKVIKSEKWLNLHSGKQFATGVRSEETKLKISNAKKGKKHTEETKQKMSEAKKGKPSPHKGKHYSEEIKKRMSESQIGQKHSEETKQKMRKTHSDKHFKHSKEAKLKISNAKKGSNNPMYNKDFSENHRKKLSEKTKQWWDQRRA